MRAHAVGDELDDLPVGLGFAEGVDGLVDALDAAFGAGEGAFFFERGGGGEDEVGVAAGLGEVDVLDDEELAVAEGVADVVGVGVGGDGVFALDVEALECAVLRMASIISWLSLPVVVGSGDSPAGFELGADGRSSTFW